MSDDLIRYDLIVQEALRSAVRKVLADVARDGLPGEHHFFITFKTGAPGVQLSARMRREYPDEMTIVLQHQFWDMNVDHTHFEVGLSFRNVPEKLSIPFDALTGFADPSVQFALRFESDLEAASGNGSTGSPGASNAADGSSGGKPVMLSVASDTSSPAGLAARRELAKGAANNKTASDSKTPAEGKSPPEKKPAPKPAAAGKDAGHAQSAPNPDTDSQDQNAGHENDKDSDSKVVSIDAFRKKT